MNNTISVSTFGVELRALSQIVLQLGSLHTKYYYY